MLRLSGGRHAERGQVLPVWTLGLIACLALSLFIVNYANILRWQVRAQNAADAAASAAISPVANGWNELTLVLYSQTVNEMRIRYLNQALINNVHGLGCSANCSSDYTSLRTALNNSVQAYHDGEIFLNTIGAFVNDRYLDPSNGAFDTITANAYSDSENDTACKDKNPNGCVNQADPAFTFTPVDIDSGNIGFGTSNLSEVAACKNVTVIAPKLFGLSAANSTFKAVAVSAFTIVPVPETFTPSTNNPATGAAYQPNENPATDVTPIYAVDFSGLTVNLYFYTPSPYPPYMPFDPATAACA